jgi:quinohemoprotein ethanol dehydrogenase
LTFGLDGQAQLPRAAPPDMRVNAVDDPSFDIRDVDAAAGRGLFFLHCAMCHGRDLVSAGAPAPDLRESQVALNPGSFWTVVHDGALLERGMPNFPMFNREQVMQIYAYIRAGAREALTPRKPDG